MVEKIVHTPEEFELQIKPLNKMTQKELLRRLIMEVHSVGQLMCDLNRNNRK